MFWSVEPVLAPAPDGSAARAASLVASGVRLVALLVPSDAGRPSYDHAIAAALSELKVPAFA